MAVHKSNRTAARKLAEADRVPTLAEARRAREWLAGPHGPGCFKDIQDTLGRVIAALRRSRCADELEDPIRVLERAIEAVNRDKRRIIVQEPWYLVQDRPHERPTLRLVV